MLAADSATGKKYRYAHGFQTVSVDSYSGDQAALKSLREDSFAAGAKHVSATILLYFWLADVPNSESF